MTTILDFDLDELVSIVAAARCDMPLACSFVDSRLELDPRTTNEHELKIRLAELSREQSERLTQKLRTMLTIDLFSQVQLFQNELASNIDSLRPSELSRAYTAAVASFTSLSAPATKDQTDYEKELLELAEESGQDIDEMRGELKRYVTLGKR